jgi:uncharacterized glyoxalase superfamily protein PhnB
MTAALFFEIVRWQRETFTQATALSATKHLKKEAEELEQDIVDGKIANASLEISDCMFLLFGIADKIGMSYEDLCRSIAVKLAKNKMRRWGKPNEDGFVEHIKD